MSFPRSLDRPVPENFTNYPKTFREINEEVVFQKAAYERFIERAGFKRVDQGAHQKPIEVLIPAQEKEGGISLKFKSRYGFSPESIFGLSLFKEGVKKRYNAWKAAEKACQIAYQKVLMASARPELSLVLEVQKIAALVASRPLTGYAQGRVIPGLKFPTQTVTGIVKNERFGISHDWKAIPAGLMPSGFFPDKSQAALFLTRVGKKLGQGTYKTFYQGSVEARIDLKTREWQLIKRQIALGEGELFFEAYLGLQRLHRALKEGDNFSYAFCPQEQTTPFLSENDRSLRGVKTGRNDALLVVDHLGKSLSQCYEEGEGKIEDVKGLLIGTSQLYEWLDRHMHQKGAYHLDIKPDNIIVLEKEGECLFALRDPDLLADYKGQRIKPKYYGSPFFVAKPLWKRNRVHSKVEENFHRLPEEKQQDLLKAQERFTLGISLVHMISHIEKKGDERVMVPLGRVLPAQKEAHLEEVYAFIESSVLINRYPHLKALISHLIKGQTERIERLIRPRRRKREEEGAALPSQISLSTLFQNAREEIYVAVESLSSQ